MKKNLLSWMTFALLFAFLIACESEPKNARLQVWLTDAPGDYDEVNIDIEGVQIHSSENDNGSGWTTLDVNAGVYNLLEFTNGMELLLAEKEIPAGKISQIRLILGDNNTLKIGSDIFDLSVPSGQQSGLKLQVHETLTDGVTYKILLDFHVAKSIHQTGNGQYKLKPVINAVTEAQSGAIKGVVNPIESTPAIFAITAEDDTVGTTYADETGHFLLRGIPAGTYKVTFEPGEDYQKSQKEGVEVQTGVVTDVGTVEVPHL